MSQKFAAREPHTFSNGAVGWRPGGPMDCLGPYAKVTNCPIGATTPNTLATPAGYGHLFQPRQHPNPGQAHQRASSMAVGIEFVP